MLAFIVALFSLFSQIQGQLPIPVLRQLGYKYTPQPNGQSLPAASGPAEVHIDAVYDHLCPDSAQAWPGLQAAVDYYNGRVSLAVHIFPLPYHHNSFFTTQAGRIVAYHGEGGDQNSRFFEYLPAMFKVQSDFWNAATADMTANDVFGNLGALVSKFGVDTTVFQAGIANSTIDEDCPISWKVMADRGAHGTPNHIVNGIFVASDLVTTADWRSLLDPVLNGTMRHQECAFA